MPLPLVARAYRFVRSDGGLTITVAILALFLFAVYPMAEVGAIAKGWLDVAFGLFLVAQPFLVVAGVLAARRKQGSTRVTVALDDDGISLTRDGKTARFAWKDVTAAGRRDSYVWYELRGQHRAPIPLRVVPDVDALTVLVRERTRWVA